LASAGVSVWKFLQAAGRAVVTNVGKFSVEIRVKNTDAFRERRMGFEQSNERFADAVAKNM